RTTAHPFVKLTLALGSHRPYLDKSYREQYFRVEVAEFNQWLQKGLGRAVVYLTTHDPGPYRDAVLYACTHDLTYDSSERDREMYMRDLIRSAGNEEFLRKGLLEAITTKPEDPDKFDLGQTIESARNFAEKGEPEIRQAM